MGGWCSVPVTGRGKQQVVGERGAGVVAGRERAIPSSEILDHVDHQFVEAHDGWRGGDGVCVVGFFRAADGFVCAIRVIIRAGARSGRGI